RDPAGRAVGSAYGGGRTGSDPVGANGWDGNTGGKERDGGSEGQDRRPTGPHAGSQAGMRVHPDDVGQEGLPHPRSGFHHLHRRHRDRRRVWQTHLSGSLEARREPFGLASASFSQIAWTWLSVAAAAWRRCSTTDQFVSGCETIDAAVLPLTAPSTACTCGSLRVSACASARNAVNSWVVLDIPTESSTRLTVGVGIPRRVTRHNLRRLLQSEFLVRRRPYVAVGIERNRLSFVGRRKRVDEGYEADSCPAAVRAPGQRRGG